MVLVVDPDLGLGVGVPDDDVGVAAWGDHTLLRIHPEHPCRRRAAGLDPALQRQLAGDDTLVDQLHAVLDATDPVGDLGEASEPHLLLVLHAERAVIGRHHGELVHPQALPQITLVTVAHLTDVVGIVILAADGGAAHPLGTLEPRLAQRLFQRQPEILRAGLGEHVATFMTGGGDLVQRVAGRHVHDVERHVAGDMAEHDGTMRGFGLERRGPGVAVELRVGVAAGQGLLHQHVDGDSVLGMHHDHRPALGGGLHGPQQLAVVAVEHARVGHEQLEAGDTLVVDEVLHALQRLLVDATDDLVEGVVDGALALCFAMPVGERSVHVAARVLHRHVDDRGDTAPRGSAGAGLERVAGQGAAKGHLHVGVHVDAAGDDVLAGRVDDPVAAFLGEVARRTERGDGLVGDQHVLGDHAGGRDDPAVLDECGGHDAPTARPVRRRHRGGDRGRRPIDRAPV